MAARSPIAVLGAGVTGLAVGSVVDAPVFERTDGPGGICRSYYLTPGATTPLRHAPAADDAYRFEIGGGHWIFGGDSEAVTRMEKLVDFRVYEREAVVRLGSLGVTVPYPLQANVDGLGDAIARTVAAELDDPAAELGAGTTLRDWLVATFGPTLCELFFLPFHDRYTAGLTDAIAPQDGYKSPAAGAQGYNSSFRYPHGGLDGLAARLAEQCDLRYGMDVVGIDPAARRLQFADGSEHGYDRLVSTLPLHVAVALSGVDAGAPPDPHTSVLVLNVGGERGARCPRAHWQYEPDADAGFHRIGFYSNVDADFLPAGCRDGTHVSMYVERAYPGGAPPAAAEVERYTRAVIDELQERDYLRGVDVVDPSWVDVAYTWRSPGSQWREQALTALADAGVTQVGRYGRWVFQGIAASMAEGFEVGEALAG